MAEQSDNTLHEATLGWAILLIVAFVLILVLWHFQQENIRDAVRWTRYGYMSVIDLVVDDDYTVNFGGEAVNFKEGYEVTSEFSKEELTYEHLAYFNALAMQPLRIPFGILMIFGAIWCIFKGPKTEYRVKMGLEGLIHRQSKNFPVIQPFAKFNPSNQPPRPPGAPVPAELPDFAEALAPEEWVAYNGMTMPDGQLEEDVAEKNFVKQLKGRWRGPGRLAPYMQVLLAAFCLKAARKRDDADAMLGRLAMCWSFEHSLQLKKDKKLLSDARKILRDKDLSASTLSKANQHAFITTAMLRALNTARDEGGVLQPAQFVWLRAYDRTLWYPLNNLGRQSLHTESLGAMAHYKAEKRTSRPIPVPKMKDAVETLKSYMESKESRPIPQVDYSNSKKRGIKKAK